VVITQQFHLSELNRQISDTYQADQDKNTDAQFNRSLLHYSSSQRFKGSPFQDSWFNFKLLAAGFWPLAAGFWPLAACSWQLATRCWSLVPRSALRVSFKSN
jgi:hypothetical protein